MKVLEFMSFDPAWFLTVPGLLITGGVVLLLIALIVFIATSKKDKGASVDPTVEGSIPIVGGPDDMSNMNNMGETQAPMGMDNTMMNAGMMPTPEMNAAAPMGMAPMPGMTDPMNNLGTVDPQPMPMPNIPENTNPAPVEMPSVNPIDMGTPMNDAPVEIPSVESAPSININAPETVANMTPGVNPTPADAPVIDFNSVTPVEAAPVIEPAMNNTVTLTEPNNARPIYGGANPLENTASIPTVSNHTAYNGEPIIPNSVVEEVKVMDAPQVAPVTSGVVVDNQAPAVPQGPTPVAPVVEPAAPTPIAETPVAPQPVQDAGAIETLDF